MKLEIISHCWQYSRLLTYQLSSLVLHAPQNVHVTMTVMCASREEDPDTWEVLDFFSQQERSAQVHWHWWPLEKPSLFRRAIGRNLAARETAADWVWFADCDMTFGPQALDSLAPALEVLTEPLAFPRRIWIHANHALGDDAIAKITTPQLVEVVPAEFIPLRYSRAIGGVQIVRGDVAREKGYCQGTRWMNPATRWRRTFEDRVFRGQLGTRGTSVSVPNIFRLRHSQRGRDCPGVKL